jgi:predicted RNase H-like HicB family nuclease
VKVRDVINTLESDGWQLVRTKGSHRQFRHPTKDRHRNGRRQVERRCSNWYPRKHLEASRAEERLVDRMEYIVILEKGETSVGAYVPDLPGCVAVADTKDQALELIREAIELHIESLRDNGESVPAPHSFVEKVAV